MKQLSSFMVMEIDGGERLSYTFSEINAETGDMISLNNKGNFFVVDKELSEHIEAIKDYIKDNRLGD